jgi:hypothetical protein
MAWFVKLSSPGLQPCDLKIALALTNHFNEDKEGHAAWPSLRDDRRQDRALGTFRSLRVADHAGNQAHRIWDSARRWRGYLPLAAAG